MQPVMPEIAAGKGKSTAGPITDRGGLVLPRFLRRPFRISMRFIQEGRWMSPRIVTVFTLLVVGGGTAAGVIHGGQADAMIARATAFLGFRVADIEIKGIKEISRIDILTNIDLGVERSLFSFDVHAAREDLKRLPWVRDVAVSKAYPDKLVVEIVERKPFAVWQNGQALYVVGRDGTEIGPYDDRFAGLPLVVGKGAAARAAEMVAATDRFPELAGRIKAYVRVGDRRWNLQARDDIVVMLPEHDEMTGLAELARLQREEAILSRAARSIDLRLPDRLVMRLWPQAAEAHREAVEASMKQAKAREHDI
ncbi:MAG: FtsQ-type POTRA domain-containing protein [Nitratireductor sp.]|nr:FtsQ-type POTRA domain-containing protein [Nitratireductor sp.]